MRIVYCMNTKVDQVGKPARGHVVVFRYPKDETVLHQACNTAG